MENNKLKKKKIVGNHTKEGRVNRKKTQKRNKEKNFMVSSGGACGGTTGGVWGSPGKV